MKNIYEYLIDDINALQDGDITDGNVVEVPKGTHWKFCTFTEEQMNLVGVKFRVKHLIINRVYVKQIKDQVKNINCTDVDSIGRKYTRPLWDTILKKSKKDQYIDVKKYKRTKYGDETLEVNSWSWDLDGYFKMFTRNPENITFYSRITWEHFLNI